MYCPYCGTKNPDRVAFCSACGRPLTPVQEQRQENPGNAAGYETQAAFEMNAQSRTYSQNPQAAVFDLDAQGSQNQQNQQEAVFDLNAQGNGGQNSYRRNGYDTQPYQAGGYGQNGYSQGGYSQGGYGQSGYGQDGYGQGGYGQNGYGQGGYGQDGYGDDGYGQGGYGQDNYNRDSYGDGYGSYSRSRQQPSKTPMILALVEIGLTVTALLIIFLGLGKMFTPEKTAERYFVYVVNGEYDKAYRMLDLEDTDFVSEETYEKYWEQYDFSEIEDYEVEDASIEEIEETEDESEEDSDEKKDKKDKKDKKKTKTTEYADVDISYHAEDDDYDNYYLVNLKKEESRKYLFFENWQILSDSVLISNFTIIAPANSMVTLDDVVLDDEYQAESETGEVRYVIPELFQGSHTLTVVAAGYAEKTETIMLYTDEEEYTISGMAYSEEVIDSLENLAAANMKIIYSTAAKGGAFSEISSLLTQDPDYQDSLRAEYEELVRFFAENDIVEIRFRQIHAQGDTADTEIQMDYSYEIDYNKQDTWDSTVSMRSSAQNDTYNVRFVEEGGSWLQTNLGCKPLYF